MPRRASPQLSPKRQVPKLLKSLEFESAGVLGLVLKGKLCYSKMLAG